MKKVGVPLTPLRTPLRKSARTWRGVHVRVELLLETASTSRPSAVAYSTQVRVVERALVLEERVVHLPELALARGRFGRLGGVLRRADGPPSSGKLRNTKRKRSPRRLLHVLDDRIGPAAVRAFVVAVLDQRDRRVGGALRVIAIGDRGVQLRAIVAQRPCSVPSWAAPRARAGCRRRRG